MTHLRTFDSSTHRALAGGFVVCTISITNRRPHRNNQARADMKTALLIGATGLTGSHLLHLLLADLRFEHIIIFVRRSTGIVHPKLEEHIVRFGHPEEWKHLVKGDVLFSALGTTVKLAGSKEAQYKVDYTYQFQFAAAASANGVPSYVLISASGANAKCSFI
jgi:uncharacterized protein YbjT (DUF2867 family)